MGTKIKTKVRNAVEVVAHVAAVLDPKVDHEADRDLVSDHDRILQDVVEEDDPVQDLTVQEEVDEEVVDVEMTEVEGIGILMTKVLTMDIDFMSLIWILKPLKGIWKNCLENTDR